VFKREVEMVAPILQNILYVEDESDIQTVAKIALENIGGFTLEICSSGGAVEVITKPFDPMTLPQRITAIWTQYHDTAKSA